MQLCTKSKFYSRKNVGSFQSSNMIQRHIYMKNKQTKTTTKEKGREQRGTVGREDILNDKAKYSIWCTFITVKITQLCPTLHDPMDYTVHGILQARILEWVAFPFSRGYPQPRDQTQVSLIAGGFFTSWATREAQKIYYRKPTEKYERD